MELPVECYRVEQIREIERLSSSRTMKEGQMILRAATAALHFIEAHFPDIERISIFCGAGNNGTDGLTLARLCSANGIDVTVFTAVDNPNWSAIAKKEIATLKKRKVHVRTWVPGTVLDTELIVDALVGIGLTAQLREPMASLVEELNAMNYPKMALDVPTGINADTGAVCGVAFDADITLTFLGLKQGLFTGPALDYVGQVMLDTLECDDLFLLYGNESALLTQLLEAHLLLPKRKRTTHKGELGHVLVIGGDYGMPGSVRLAAEAALRSGAGLVTVATRPEHVPVVVSSRPELMCFGVQGPADLAPLLARATAVIIGPGMTHSAWSQALVTSVLQLDLPLIVDAGALQYVPALSHKLPNAILTPHPGEMATLLGCDVETIQQDRFAAAQEANARFGAIIVLKGAGTLTVMQDQLPEICGAGNPGMATAGMGDVLNGVIAGLLAAGLHPFDAARAGVVLHARSADLAEREQGECGLLASDLFPYLQQILNPWVELRAQLESLTENGDDGWDEPVTEDSVDDLDDDDNEVLH